MHGESTFVVAQDHPAFAGHFPGRPILPGVVLLEAAVRNWLQAARSGASADDYSGGFACRINAAKFLSPVSPGETLTLRYSTMASGSTHFEILGAHRKVAEGTLALSSDS